MASVSDDNAADLFAIPDFWKPSSLEQQHPPPLAAHARQDGFFRLALGAQAPVAFFLGPDDPPASDSLDGGGFFTIPAAFTPTPLAGASASEKSVEGLQNTLPAGPEEPASTDAVTETSLLDDFFLYPDNHPAIAPPPEYKTWSSFEHAPAAYRIPVFATEQGPDFVNALAVADSHAKTGPAVSRQLLISAHAYYSCLLALALGRSSALFAWNECKGGGFHRTVEGVRVSGFTAPTLRSVDAVCLACGNDTRLLRAFVDRTYHSTVSATAQHAKTPSRVALARCIDDVLLVVQRELGVRGQQAASCSLLQLQARIRPVASLVSFVRALVAKLTEPAASSDEAFLSRLFEEAQSTEYSVVFSVQDVLKQLLQLVSEPWLAFVRAWIGLAPDSKATLWTGDARQSRSFVRRGTRFWIDDMGLEQAEPDYLYDGAHMPAFIPAEMARSLFETGRNLRFLWTNHPNHPLSNLAAVFTGPANEVWSALPMPPPLQWQFDWKSIHALEVQVLVYEQALSRVLSGRALNQQTMARMLDEGSTATNVGEQPQTALPIVQLQERHAEKMEQYIEASMARLDAPLPQPADDGLVAVLRSQLFHETDATMETGRHHSTAAFDDFTPHWSLFPLLSFGPVIAAQARLVNRACISLLFSTHKLRVHLQLQRSFQLLGNGVFCSRLSHALFDTERTGAGTEDRRMDAGSGLGLRLAARNQETWPPASSELRLALIGVLAESFDVPADMVTTTGPTATAAAVHELPGGMSFAVRDLAPEDIDRCMDPDALEALDFLRLSYKPPEALAAVITPTLLVKYDRIFWLLLRVLRVSYVVDQLMRHGRGRGGSDGGCTQDVSTRFRFEARHFVSNIMAYFLDTGVGLPWQQFDRWLDCVENGDKGLSSSSAAVPGEISPEQLRARHEQALDEIMLALLLRKRQQPLLKLLEAILGLILAYAKLTREHAQDHDKNNNKAFFHQVTKLHASFRKKVATFLAVCRGLSEKEADSVARKDYHQQQQYQDGSRAGEGSALSVLLLMLDYNGWLTNEPGR